MYFALSTLGAWGKTRLKSRIKKAKPPLYLQVRIPGTKEEAKQKYKEALENAINKGKKGGAGKKKKKTQKKKKTTNSKKDEL